MEACWTGEGTATPAVVPGKEARGALRGAEGDAEVEVAVEAVSEVEEEDEEEEDDDDDDDDVDDDKEVLMLVAMTVGPVVNTVPVGELTTRACTVGGVAVTSACAT